MLKFCKARNYTRCKVQLTFVWVIDRVTEDRFRWINMHRTRLLLQNSKISCSVCVDVSTTNGALGFSQVCFCCPWRENADYWAKAECFECLAVTPCDPWEKQEAWEQKETGIWSTRGGNFWITDLGCPVWPCCLEKHADGELTLMSWPSGTQSVLQWEERGVVCQECCSQTTSSSGRQAKSLILWAKASPSIHMSVPSLIPCLNEKSGPSLHEAAHARCWTVNKSNTARVTKEVII